MKKIFSLLIAVATVLSTASAVFAANYSYTLTPSVTEAKPGDVIEFELRLTGTPGIAYFKNVLSFDGSAFAHEQYFSEDDYDYVDAYSKLGAVTYNETESGRALLVMTRATDNKNPWLMTVCYKVADDVVNGEYTFTIDDEQVLQAAGTKLDIEAATATIKVTGGKDPAPAGPTVVEGVADTADLETSTIDGSKYTGVTATFVGDKYTAITFNFNDGSADGSYVWELGEDIVSIDSNMVFGLNIQNIPAEITTFTCTGVTATVAE